MMLKQNCSYRHAGWVAQVSFLLHATVNRFFFFLFYFFLFLVKNFGGKCWVMIYILQQLAEVIFMFSPFVWFVSYALYRFVGMICTAYVDRVYMNEWSLYFFLFLFFNDNGIYATRSSLGKLRYINSIVLRVFKSI